LKYRQFGNTGLEVSAITFGGWPMGGTQYGPTDDDSTIQAVHEAIDHGITCFDTAAAYGLGHSEKLMGQAIENKRQDIIVVTKGGLTFDPDKRRLFRDGSEQAIIEGCDGSLKRLNTDYIDLYLIHWPDPTTPFEETMKALDKLKTAGKIRHIGVSNFMPSMMADCLKHVPLTTNQVGYSLFERRIERDVKEFCEKSDVGIMAYGSLAHGLLSENMNSQTQFVDWDWRSTQNVFGMPLFKPDYFTENINTVDTLNTLAQKHNVTVQNLAISWLLSNQIVTTSLIGFRTPSEVQNTIATMDFELDAELIEKVDKISEHAYKLNVAGEDISPAVGTWNPWDPKPSKFGSTSK
jgi:aryl-alcohol dehydrogenase-like predicted oxidoreductase